MASSLLAHLGRLLVTFLLFASVALLSHLPLGPEEVAESGLRLALKTRAGTARICRELSPAELAALPIHMRAEESCFEFAVPYDLSLKIDGRLVLERHDRASGIRGDRPLVVGESILLEPGARRVELDFVPSPAPETGDPTETENWRLALESAPSYHLDETLSFEAGRVALIALDEATGEVRVR
ncbi:MAG: hypothetical protein K8J08_16495 [Thermoanaerobaculia bacterium]|nr:hypothetical protein [Thermoanaerobaculia bacterium]